MKIGILGGTFDPPHNGHLALASAAMSQLELDEVLFIPASRNPLKNKRPTPGKHRIEMLRLAIEGMDNFASSDLELVRGGPSYAVDTVAELQYVNPAEYWFILGADALRTLPNWKQPDRLFKLCRLAVAVRPPTDAIEVQKFIPAQYRSFIDIIEMPPVAVSGTEIRDKLAKHQSVALWVPKAVIQYIQSNKLYQI